MPEQPPTLRDMINDALAKGITYRQLEARAVDPETQRRASRSIFNDIATSKLDRMPHVDHLRAIAVALGVPYERVRQAAIRQWLPADQTSAEEPETDPDLELARQLQATAEQLLARAEERRHPETA